MGRVVPVVGTARLVVSWNPLAPVSGGWVEINPMIIGSAWKFKKMLFAIKLSSAHWLLRRGL